MNGLRGRVLDCKSPVEWGHPLNQGLLCELASVPLSGWTGASRIRDLVRGKSGVTNPNDATFNGGTAWKGGGPNWQCLNFDGNPGSYAGATDTGFPSGTASRTVLCRLRLKPGAAENKAFASYGRPGNATGGSNGQMVILLTSGTPTVGFSDYGTSHTGSTTLSANVWYDFGLTISGTTLTLYLGGGGLIAHKENTVSGIASSAVLNGHLVLGARWDDDTLTAENHNIDLDDFAIYNYAMTDGKMAAVMEERARGNPNRWRWLRGLGVTLPPAPSVQVPYQPWYGLGPLLAA